MTHSKETKQTALHLLQQGKSYNYTAKTLNIGTSTVNSWAQEAGITRPKGRQPQEPSHEIKAVLNLLRHGLNIYQACKITGVPTSRIYKSRHRNKAMTINEEKTAAGYRLTYHERLHIAYLHHQGQSTRQIAQATGRNQSTIARELMRNRTSEGTYNPTQAEHAALTRRTRPKVRKLESNRELRRIVIGLFAHTYSERIPLNSPVTVAARLKHMYPHDPSMHISAESLYQAIYIQGAGSLRQEIKLEKALRSGRTSRLPRSPLAGMKHTRASRSWVAGAEIAVRDQLFPEVEQKLVPGHWEGDLVIGQDGKNALVTLVERASRFSLIRRLPDNHESQTVTELLTQMVKEVADPGAWKTLTWDQGVEMAMHERFFRVHDDFRVFFADPHSPWQRGANEGLNRLVREFFPKGTDFSLVSDEEVHRVQVMLNDRVRLVLKGRTPAEVLPGVLLGDALTA